MPFLLAKILNFQGTVHLIGVGSLSYKLKQSAGGFASLRMSDYEPVPRPRGLIYELYKNFTRYP